MLSPHSLFHQPSFLFCKFQRCFILNLLKKEFATSNTHATVWKLELGNYCPSKRYPLCFKSHFISFLSDPQGQVMDWELVYVRLKQLLLLLDMQVEGYASS